MRELRLSGNKMADSVLNELEDLMQRRATTGDDSNGGSGGGGGGGGSGGGGSIADELHLAKSRAEEYEKEMTKLHGENKKLKEDNREGISKVNLMHAQELTMLSTKIDSLEKQLNDSATQISSMEIKAVREKEKVDKLTTDVADAYVASEELVELHAFQWLARQKITL